MKNNESHFITFISSAAIAGNILFTLWILYNGINEGFQGTTIEIFSYVILMGLLIVNAFLLILNIRNIRNRRQNSRND